GAPAVPGAPADPAAAAQPGAPAGQPAQAQIDPELAQAVENFWHYGKTFRYDLALAEGQRVLSKRDNPPSVLAAFERTAQQRGDNLEQYLLRWQGTQQLKEVTSQIMTLLNEGRRARSADPGAVERNVRRLADVGRGHMLAVRDLRNSGELAVPIMIDYLRDPGRAEFHAGIRQALVELGRPVLNPLVAVTESKNPDLLVAVVTALGELGYGSSVPYISRVANGNDYPAAARNAAAQALQRMGAGNAQQMNVADQFYELGEKFYYDNADIAADKRDPANPANIWYWDEGRGLIRVQVPQVIFNEIMAMRAGEYSLRLGQASGGDALSLWLAANYKREAELPEGAPDLTRAQNQPSAHFYGVNSGAQFLNNALARGLRDRNSQVSLRVIKSLQEIVGRTNLFSGAQQGGGGGAPALIDAMSSADRLVRFESAFAIAAALPNQGFQGQERVVPLLAEAMSQTGVPSAIVVMPSEDMANNAAEALRQAGYNAVGAAGPEAAVNAANQLPAVDVVIAAEEMGAPNVDRLLLLASQNGRLAGAAKVVLVRSGASPYALRAVNEPLLSIAQVQDVAALKIAADAARAKASSLPIDQQSAGNYALRAANLLQRVALAQINGPSPVFDLSAAEQTVLLSLRDPRPDVVKAAGDALAHMNARAGQSALLQQAIAPNASDDVRVSLLKSLSISAKFFGNRLQAQQVTTLDQLVEGAQNQDVKNAAAEARGALNLPAQQSKTLIVNQSRV
ncbi:MAG TPA: hypothetical protein VER17_16800, partial [Tepidisphaeraceae bacterium]|nr:hypothetical protein [Tepidisphaeraceae bacterium]